MEISDTKIAITAIVIIVAMLTAAAYMAGVMSETLALGLATGAIGAAAGLAGVEIGKAI